MSVYLQLLEFPGVRRQVLAAWVSRMTQPLLTLPLLVGIDQVYDDHALAALMVGLYTVSFAAMMPVTGRLVDRYGARIVLRVWLGLALAALLGTGAALSLRTSVPTLAVSVVALGACLPPVGAVTRAGWPLLVPPAQLRAAYALDSVINEAATIAGPLLAALTLTTLTPSVALMVASLALLTGSLGLPPRVLARSTPPAGQPPTHRHRGPLLLICAIALCASMGVGSMVATAGLLASDAGEPGLAGLLLAVVAVGAVVAGAVAGRREVPAEVLARRLAWYSGGVAGVLLVLSLALHAVGGLASDAAGMLALAGCYLLFGCLTGPRDALLQLSIVREVPAAERGTAFSWLGTCGLSGFGLGSAASGFTAATLGLPLLAALIVAVVALLLTLAAANKST